MSASVHAFAKYTNHFETIVNEAAFFAFDQGGRQLTYPAVVLLQESQSGSHYFAGTSVPAIVELFCDEGLEVAPNCYASISR
ncbi:MAG: hypothetical protein ACI9WC_001148 [Arenicella sp.]